MGSSTEGGTTETTTGTVASTGAQCAAFYGQSDYNASCYQ